MSTADESDDEMIWQMRAKCREHPLTSGRHLQFAEASSRLPRRSRTLSTAPPSRQTSADTITRPPATATVSTITATATPAGACLPASAVRQPRHPPNATAITTTTAPIAHSQKKKTTCLRGCCTKETSRGIPRIGRGRRKQYKTRPSSKG
jgi:hypothetical protein